MTFTPYLYSERGINMAVDTIVMDLTLRLVLNNGLDKNGKQF